MSATKMLNIEGMSCKHCAATIEQALSALPGVQKVAVNFKKGQAKIKTDTEITDAVLGSAISNAGFEYKGVAA